MVVPASKRLALAIALSVASLTAAACSSDSDDSNDSSDAGAASSTSTSAASGSDSADRDGDGGGPNPCSLLSAAEVESVVGIAIEGTFNDQLSNDFQQICDWTTTEAVAGVQVLVIADGPVADFDSQRESANDSVGPAVDVEITGADRAYAVAEGAIIGMQIGESFVQVSNLGTGGQNVTMQFAELVAGNY